MLYVEGNCPSCDAGLLGFRRCDDGKTLVLMCDECDAVWLDPADQTIEAVRYPGVHSFKIPGLPYKLGGGAAGWATRAEVERAGWQADIKGEAPALGENRKRR
jgi:Zn-finger nucleic acid-binding protein